MSALYFAGPLFTDAERQWNAAQVATLRAALPHVEIVVPQEFGEGLVDARGLPDHGRIFQACVDHLTRSHVVLAILDGADADSGTCWEVGYAYARRIPVIGLRTDWRPGEDNGTNCMLSRSCHHVCRTMNDCVVALRSLIA